MKFNTMLWKMTLPAALMLAACGPKEEAAKPAEAAPAEAAAAATPEAPAAAETAKPAEPVKRMPMPSDPMKAKDAAGNNMIHLVAERGNKDVLESLLMRGSEIDPLNNASQTPLHLAVIKGHVNTATVLLERGANPNAKDKDGKTPLDYAGDKTDLVNLLMSKGAKKE